MLREELDLSPGIFVTVMEVRTSPDLKHATVFIDVIPPSHRPSMLEKVSKRIYHIQKQLNERMIMRYVPKLRFALDDKQQKVERIEELLGSAEREE